jgi:hypothetical protein
LHHVSPVGQTSIKRTGRIIVVDNRAGVFISVLRERNGIE